MVDLVDRAQELEQIQRDEALERVLDRTRHPPATSKQSPSPDQPTKRDDA